MKLEAFWRAYLRHASLPLNTPMPESFHFEMNETSANRLLALVLQGKKTATSSALSAYTLGGEPLPQSGETAILTDWAGEPWCVIETTRVTILPFDRMTDDLARIEGEHANLQGWRENHEAFFKLEGAQIGYSFSADMLLVFEEFRIVYART